MSSRRADNHRPLVSITPDDRGGYVVLTIYLSFFVTLIFWTTRLTIRWRKSSLKLDDVFLILAMGLAVTQSICMQLDVNAGLGTRDLAEDAHLSRFEELNYAALLLYILSQACSKLSINILFHSLQPFNEFIKASYAMLSLTLAWATVSFLMIAFQCRLPHPWKLGADRCLNLHTVHIVIDVLNIVSEVGIILLPAALMPKIQTTWSIRLLVIGSFALRLWVIGALIPHIVVSSMLTDYANAPWAYTLPAIWVQIIMNASLLFACIPGMQQVLRGLRPGMTALTVREDSHDTSKTKSVLGLRSNVHTNCSKAGGSAWEMFSIGQTKPGNGEDDDTKSECRLTESGIVVTREVAYVEESEDQEDQEDQEGGIQTVTF